MPPTDTSTLEILVGPKASVPHQSCSRVERGRRSATNVEGLENLLTLDSVIHFLGNRESMLRNNEVLVKGDSPSADFPYLLPNLDHKRDGAPNADR
jgi:hypothetical protein